MEGAPATEGIWRRHKKLLADLYPLTYRVELTHSGEILKLEHYYGTLAHWMEQEDSLYGLKRIDCGRRSKYIDGFYGANDHDGGCDSDAG